MAFKMAAPEAPPLNIVTNQRSVCVCAFCVSLSLDYGSWSCDLYRSLPDQPLVGP